MTAACLIYGCGWNADHVSAVRLELLAEKHRRASHEWVAVGRCHTITDTLPPAAEEEQKPAPRAETPLFRREQGGSRRRA